MVGFDNEEVWKGKEKKNHLTEKMEEMEELKGWKNESETDLKRSGKRVKKEWKKKWKKKSKKKSELKKEWLHFQNPNQKQLYASPFTKLFEKKIIFWKARKNPERKMKTVAMPVKRESEKEAVSENPAKRLRQGEPQNEKVDYGDLEVKGWKIIPIYGEGDIENIYDCFKETLERSPELSENFEFGHKVALGGVQYLPLPGFWYSEFSQNVHGKAYKEAVKMFKNLPGIDKELYFSASPDRFMMRPGDLKPDTNAWKNLWHQDAAPNTSDEDKVFGGWLNLNTYTQYFRCLDGTHSRNSPLFDELGIRNHHKDGGFDKFSKEDQKRLTAYWNKTGKMKDVKIPPGHMLVFYENIIHTVLSNPHSGDKPLLRLHCSWVISPKAEALHNRPKETKGFTPLRKYFEKRELVPVRSGQQTPVYSTLHLWDKGARVENLSCSYNLELFEEKNLLLKKYLPEKKLVPRFLPSAETMGFSDKLNVSEDFFALFSPTQFAYL
jgi:hypothetical protein